MAPSPKPVRLAPLLRFAIGLLVLLVALPARADLTTSALSWVRLPGSESCIPTPELGARIEKHLGRPVLVSPSIADVSIEGRAEATGSGAARRFKVVVGGTRRDGTLIGSRELTSSGPDCRALDDALVLVIALMIDPDALAPAEPAAAPPLAAPPTVTREIVNERTVVHEVERVQVGSPPWIVEASVAGVAAIERLVGSAAGLALGLRAGPTKLLAFQLTLDVVPATELTVGSRAVDFTILEGGLAFCPAIPLARRIDVGGCLGMRVGAVRSQGRGFGNDREVDRGLADVAIGPHLEVTLAGPLFAVVTATALVPLVRQQTTLTDAAGKTVLIDERSALGAEIGAGVGVRFSP